MSFLCFSVILANWTISGHLQQFCVDGGIFSIFGLYALSE